MTYSCSTTDIAQAARVDWSFALYRIMRRLDRKVVEDPQGTEGVYYEAMVTCDRMWDWLVLLDHEDLD